MGYILLILFIFIFISALLYRPVAVSNPLTATLRNITIPQTNKGFSTDPKAGSIETRYCQLSKAATHSVSTMTQPCGSHAHCSVAIGRLPSVVSTNRSWWSLSSVRGEPCRTTRAFTLYPSTSSGRTNLSPSSSPWKRGSKQPLQTMPHKFPSLWGIVPDKKLFAPIIPFSSYAMALW